MNDGGGDYNSYSTLLFGGIPNFFVENLKNIPISVDGWISNSTYYQNGLEIIINKELKNIKEKILSIPCESIDSMIDHLIEREYGMNNIFFYDGNNFYIFLFNEHEQTIVNMYINDDIYMDINLCEREYNIHKININDFLNKKIKLNYFIDNELETVEKYLDEKTINKLKKSNKIVFN